MTIGRLIGCYVALLVLLAATVASAYLELGTLNIVLNVGIAAAKAALIAWIFMHLSSGETTMRVVAVVIVLWIVILFSLTFVDHATRPLQPEAATLRSETVMRLAQSQISYTNP